MDERQEQVVDRLLADLPEPAPGADVRVARRLARTMAVQPSAWSRLPLRVGAYTGGLAAAATAIFFVAHRPAPVDVALVSDVGFVTHNLPKASVTFRGDGRMDGDEQAPRIAWQRGILHVEVQPEQGVDLRVETREAVVRVVGTGFSVERDALGTVVEVRHGRVETRCADDDAPVMLEGGDSRTCLPTSAAGLLGRAQALREAGAPATDVLAALDAGLALAPAGDPAREELLGARLRVLAETGEVVPALDVARALLAETSGVRREEVLALATRLALAAGGCEAAAPWLLPVAGDTCRAP